MMTRSERTSIGQDAGSGSRGFVGLRFAEGYSPEGSPTRVRKTGTSICESTCRPARQLLGRMRTMDNVSESNAANKGGMSGNLHFWKFQRAEYTKNRKTNHLVRKLP
jgi:hypothetical protein